LTYAGDTFDVAGAADRFVRHSSATSRSADARTRFIGNTFISDPAFQERFLTGRIRPMETDVYPTQRAKTASTFAFIVAHALLIVVTSGCAIVGSRNEWTPPPIYTANALFGSTDARLASAEAQFAAGQEAELACNPVAIDHYFAAAVESWPYYVACPTAEQNPATQLYQSAVRAFIDSAVRFGHFNQLTGVTLANGQRVPVNYQGFIWQPADFCTFLPVGYYESPRLSKRYATSGVGVSYVVLTSAQPRQPFIKTSQPFAATAVLAPAPSFGGGFALQFYDPLRTNTSSGGQPLTRDLTAPIAYAASQDTDAWLIDFLRPDRGDPLDGLHMREPFQPGKIPVILVHGLASDPLTWAQLENDLRNQPAISARYQLWFFRYDTGDPFLASATRLRQQLAAARQTYDPMRVDQNLSRMVLVGHSMGGLLSKMQVTYSGDTLWNAAATRPLHAIVTDQDTRDRLASNFYFTPSPDIRRVIYIATPHRGSSDATRCIGRISSALVEERPDWVARHRQLVRDNPDAFREELKRGVPTSIDLLEPQSCVLQATDMLPYSPCVALHSIIGDDRWSPIQGRSDGVVAVSSARIAGVQSELLVDAKHTEVQRDPNTVREVICILNQHAAYVQ
jgi:pimeloyl-ACP methyl ester carboxylesterase